MTEKRCTHCGELKALDEFYFSAKRAHHFAQCKVCYRQYDQKQREERLGVWPCAKPRRGDPTPAEIAERAAAIRAENFEREMAGEVLGEHGNAAWRVEREPRVYHHRGHAGESDALTHSLRTTERERMDWVRVP